MDEPKRVLFLCTANSARSQMAEGLARWMAGDRLEVASAGAEPSRVHPLAIEAMAEIGVDISSQRSQAIEEFLDQPFDFVVTVCDRAAQVCPTFPGPGERLHWSLADPAAWDDREVARAAFGRTRDELERRLSGWLDSVL